MTEQEFIEITKEIIQVMDRVNEAISKLPIPISKDVRHEIATRCMLRKFKYREQELERYCQEIEKLSLINKN